MIASQHPLYQASNPIVAPLVDVEGTGYIPEHVNLFINQRQGAALKSLTMGLDAQGARLIGGKRIQTGPDAVRWLLENLTPESAGMNGMDTKVSN